MDVHHNLTNTQIEAIWSNCWYCTHSLKKSDWEILYDGHRKYRTISSCPGCSKQLTVKVKPTAGDDFTNATFHDNIEAKLDKS